MRLVLFLFASLAALVVPAAVLAGSGGSAEAGTLVVKNGMAPLGTPVVVLVIRGAAIGQVTGYGRILIRDESPDDEHTPEVTGADWQKDQKDKGQQATVWGGPGFRFRAVGGAYTITIWGSGVNLVASGRGTVALTGSPEAPLRDGEYSLNGGDFRSLPAPSVGPRQPIQIGG
jgi:hypothetical protein